MSWLSVFIKSEVSKALWKLSVEIFKLKLGQGGSELIEAAKKAASKAELSGRSGSEKKEMVVAALKSQFKETKKGFIDSAVQLAWMWVDEFVKENAGNISRLRNI